jgi:hypothetical protein
MILDSIFDQINNASNNLEEVQKQLFNVVKLPLFSNVPDFQAPENTFGVYKSSGGKPLSVMGKDFTPLQPQEFLDRIVYTVHECGANLDLSTLDFKEFNAGKNIAFSIALPKLDFKNQAGFRDETHNRLTFSTSYDGSKSSEISLYTWRKVCSNGMMGWGLTAMLKGKNTIGGKAKILTYCDEAVKIITSAKSYNERILVMDKVKVTKQQIEAFKFNLLGYNSESLLTSEKSETKRINILNRINETIELEFTRAGQTAFGLLNGITNYTNHEANGSKTISDEEYIRFGNGSKLNNLAQKLVFEMN